MSLRTARVLALVVGLAGVGLRLYDVGRDSFDVSEVARIRLADPALRALEKVSEPVVEPPVPGWVTRWALRYGYDEGTLRLPSALAGAAALLALWLLSQSLFDATTAMFAVSMLALSPLHVAISRQVGPEAWLTLFAILTVWAFHRAASAPHSLSARVLCTICATLACWSSYAALLLLAALVLWQGLSARRTHQRRIAVEALVAMTVPIAAVAVWAYLNPPDTTPSLFHAALNAELVRRLVNATAGDNVGLGTLVLGCVVVGAVRTARAGERRGSLIAWTIVGVVGVVIADLWLQFEFRSVQMAVALPGCMLLAGAALAWIGTAVMPAGRRVVILTEVGVLVAMVALQWPVVSRQLQTRRPAWREATAVVRRNAGPEDRIVVLIEGNSFTFYAPEMIRRVSADMRPGPAAALFAQPERAWLVVPEGARLYPGWAQIDKWFTRFPPLDLTPGPGVEVFYMGKGDRDRMLLEVAFMDLPTSTLVRGSLLLDLLTQVGTIPPVLWKVEQVALSRNLELRNPDLLKAVYLLAEHGRGDRAASLAYRLVTAEPDWPEARQALAAFQSTAPPT